MASTPDYRKIDDDYHKAVVSMSAHSHTYVPTSTSTGITYGGTGVYSAPVAVFLGTVCGGSLTIAVFGNIGDNSFDIFITHPSHTERPWTVHLDQSGTWDGSGVVTAVDHAVDCYLYANSHVATELGIAVSEPEPWPTHPTGYTHVTYGTAITSWASVPSAAASRSR